MTTNHIDHAPDTEPTSSTNPPGRIALQVVAVAAVFVAAYLATSTLLTDGYDSETTAIRMGVAGLAALIAAGALFLAKRFK